MMSSITTTKTATENGGTAQSVPPTAHPAQPAPRNRRLPNRVAVLFVVCALMAAGARLAWFLPAVQEWRLSRASLDSLLKESVARPDDARLLYHVGYRLNREQRFAEAEGPLSRAVGLDPDDARLRDEWARALLGVGKVSEAFTELRQFVGIHPDSALGHRALGKFYFTQKSLERAHDEFEKAVSLAPNDAEAWANTAQAAGQIGVKDRPLEAARKAVSLAPNDANYRLLLAPLLATEGKTEEAGREYARAAELAPGNAAARQQYAAYLMERATDAASRAKAEAEIRAALTLDEKDGHTQLLLGRLLRDTGRTADAVAPLTKAAELSEEDPAPAHELTQAYGALGKPAEAAKWQATWQKRQAYAADRYTLYQKLRVSPDSRDLHRQMARLLGTHGNVEDCLRHYAAALRRAPDSMQALTAAARDLTEGGYPDRALPLAQQAVTLGKFSPEAHEAMGDALLQTGQMDKAIAQYNYTTNYLPSRAPVIQERVNRYAAAHPQALSPAEKAYREALGLTQGQIGLSRTPTHALELMEQANARDPSNLTYLRLLLKLQFGARKTTDAIATARRIVAIAPDDIATEALLAVMLVERAGTPEQFSDAEQHIEAIRNRPEVAAQYHYASGLLALARRDGPRAVTELREASRLDPDADVTFYKLAQAERLCGHTEAAAKAQAEFEHRQTLKHEEFGLQGDVSQHPNDPAAYRKLAEFYARTGRTAEEKAMRAVIRTRFSATKGSPAQRVTR